MPSKSLFLLALAAGLAGAQTIPNNVTFRNFFGTMTFTRPVAFVPYPGADSAYVVLQQNGRVVTVRRQNNAWAKTDSALITVTGGTSSGNEQGLLGFAFHPDYATTRKYYVYYITGSGGVDLLAERTADGTLRPKTADAQRTLLRVTDPYPNHNGGTIAFGPDGYLYIGLGDGGSGGDPQNRAQNTDSLLGKILRLDVDGADAFSADTARNYAIPVDNPFVGQSGYKPEIWAYGLRNPWKWSFHPTTGELWVGDVGQSYMEEVSRVPKGGNMGWKIREGNTCFNTSNNSSPLASCNSTGMAPSIINLPRSKAQSITGGAFFTGNPSSAYHGVYIFGDYATDSVWAARFNGDQLAAQIRIGAVNSVSSFNRDNQGRVFALNVDNGVVNILESPDMVPAPVGVRPDRRSSLKPIRMGDLLRDPGSYTVRGLDGREIHGRFSGTAWVREKGSANPPRLMTVVW